MRKVMVLAGLLLVLAGCGTEPKPSDDRLGDLPDALIDEVDAGRERAVERIAEIVWTTFPGEVSEVQVEINSGRTLSLRANELTEKFGERPDGLVEKDGTVTVVLIAAGVLLAGLVVLVWWRRRDRNRTERGMPT